MKVFSLTRNHLVTNLARPAPLSLFGTDPPPRLGNAPRMPVKELHQPIPPYRPAPLFAPQPRHRALPERPAAAQISSDAEANRDATLPDELCEAAAQLL